MQPTFPDTLVLNTDYRPLSYLPLSTWDWQTTIFHVVKGTVDVVEYYDERFIRSPRKDWALPSVVALKTYKPVAKTAAFTRFNVMLRDGFRCQYCGGTFVSHELTFDHVKPRCRGGVSCWENVVAACRPCNGKKSDRLDMRPLRAPFRPSVYQLQEEGRKFPPKHLHESWNDYLYWDTPLDET